jgi:hypothetical protein
MEWIDPKDELPPQGKKILYFKKGDIHVVQRFGDLWLPIPFYDSQYAFHDAPDLWTDIIPPEGYTGKVFFMVPEDTARMFDADEYEMFYPEQYKELVESQREMWLKNEVD